MLATLLAADASAKVIVAMNKSGARVRLRVRVRLGARAGARVEARLGARVGARVAPRVGAGVGAMLRVSLTCERDGRFDADAGRAHAQPDVGGRHGEIRGEARLVGVRVRVGVGVE